MSDTSATHLPAWTLVIPGWTPPLLNPTVGYHWAAIHRRKTDAANLLGIYRDNIPKVTDTYRPVRRLLIHCEGWRTGRLPDPDALLKILFDALKIARLIVDDGQDWLKWERPTLSRAKHRRTVLTLSDIPCSREHGESVAP